MRCDQCNKFASFDTDVDPEVNTEEVADDGSISLEVRITNNCAECGQELKEANFELEDQSLTDEVEEHRKECKDGSLEMEVDVTRTERTQDKDRRGKPIKSSRYMKRFYGVEATATVTCSCGHEFGQVTISDDVQASGMDELI